MLYGITADIHLRSTVPINRTDDYLQVQEDKIKFILNACKKRKATLLVAGDFGHVSEWSNRLLARIIELIKEYDVKIITTFGQHDLANHRHDKWEESALAVLHQAKVVDAYAWYSTIKDKGITITCCPYGILPKEVTQREDITNILLIHKMIIKQPLWPGQKATRAANFLKKYKYDLIISGDNHQAFIEKYKDRTLINPGSVMRSKIDQKLFKPRIYFYNTITNELEKVYIPIKRNVFRKVVEKEPEERMDDFINHIKQHKRITTSYKQNVKNWLQTYPQRTRVKIKIWEAINNGNNIRKGVNKT